MARQLQIVAVVLSITAPAVAQDSLDLVGPDGKLTDRGTAMSFVALAEVLEMRCGVTGRLDAAIQKLGSMGIHVDVNRKEDFADITFLATEIFSKAAKAGFPAWCKMAVPGFADSVK
jgi:hypothetical protein